MPATQGRVVVENNELSQKDYTDLVQKLVDAEKLVLIKKQFIKKLGIKVMRKIRKTYLQIVSTILHAFMRSQPI